MQKKLKYNFKDKRGSIIDIFVNSPKDHCTLVTFNKNSVRGNHFHKKSTQYSFIISGKLKMITAKVDKKGKLVGKIKKRIISENTLIAVLSPLKMINISKTKDKHDKLVTKL